jgi:hypothetical protein
MLHRPPPRASTMPARSSPPPSQHHLILHCVDASSLTDPAINTGDRSTGLAPTSTSAHDAPVWEANASESPDLFPLKSVPRRPLMPLATFPTNLAAGVVRFRWAAAGAPWESIPASSWGQDWPAQFAGLCCRPGWKPMLVWPIGTVTFGNFIRFNSNRVQIFWNLNQFK